MKLKQAEKIIKLLNDIDIDVSVEDIQDCDSVDCLNDCLMSNGLFDIEIIYYSKAMDYLSEHDSSLKESLGLAHDIGYEVKDLNSELLASIHASQKAQDDFWELKDEIEEILK